MHASPAKPAFTLVARDTANDCRVISAQKPGIPLALSVPRHRGCQRPGCVVTEMSVMSPESPGPLPRYFQRWGREPSGTCTSAATPTYPPCRHRSVRVETQERIEEDFGLSQQRVSQVLQDMKVLSKLVRVLRNSDLVDTSFPLASYLSSCEGIKASQDPLKGGMADTPREPTRTGIAL